jgi:hypothetical protein
MIMLQSLLRLPWEEGSGEQNVANKMLSDLVKNPSNDPKFSGYTPQVHVFLND